MASVLSADKQNAIIGSLCEGSSVRSIERITGVHRDTIMRLGVRIGQGCTSIMNAKMRNLSCTRLEITSPLLAVRAVIIQEFRNNAPAEA